MPRSDEAALREGGGERLEGGNAAGGNSGKNLNRLRPMSNPRMMSPAVAMPGKKGIPDAELSCSGTSVRPGETMNRAPA